MRWLAHMATSTSPRSRWGPTTLQATKALLDADAYPGPSLVIAYSTCIAHGIDMSKSMTPPEGRSPVRLLAPVPVPPVGGRGGPPFKLDSKAPTVPLADFIATEARYATLARTNPRQAARLARPGPGRRHRAVAVLRAAGLHAADRSLGRVGRRTRSASDTGYRYDEEVK